MSVKKRPAVKLPAALICVFTVLSLVVNCAISSHLVNLSPNAISSAISNNQPLLQYYSSMAVEPLNMLSKLISAKAAGIKTPLKGQTQGAKAGGAFNSDHSLVLPGSITGIVKLQSSSLFAYTVLQSDAAAGQRDSLLQLMMTGLGPCILFMYIMLFLITLRRRSLPAPCITKLYFLKTQS